MKLTILSLATKEHFHLNAKLLAEIKGHTVVTEFPNLQSGDIFTEAFYDIMQRKINAITRELYFGCDYLIYLDSDIALQPNAIEVMIDELEQSGKDILFQSDQYTYCAGMFVCRNNQSVKNLFDSVALQITDEEVRLQYLSTTADQAILNDTIRENPDVWNVGFLSDRFTTYGNIGDGSLWMDNEFDLPEDCLGFHANYTIGIKDKEKLLQYVRTKFARNIH